MATKEEKLQKQREAYDILVEAFDAEDFKRLLNRAHDSTRLNAYMNILRIMTLRAAKGGDNNDDGEVKKLLASMFESVSKKK